MNLHRNLVMGCFLSGWLCASALAQLRPPERALVPISDASQTIMDRAALLEVLPTHRAVSILGQRGRIRWRITSNHASNDPIGPAAPGVLFNHSMQTFGYFSGEIAFKLKAGMPLATITSSRSSAVTLVTHPDVYALSTGSAQEFLLTLKELQKHPEVQWVEPTVHYVGAEEATK